ncbi:Techylectin-5B [Amphibalanus amphitrite]|uniref:Techylectin-5B n=2 Tax=Amphibalanus amphitrite TaxID=1232801 RepID=A0A6A4WU51_AMPAM|nr:Techylectin-5B [Amphibalanus amphitrite]
MPNIRQFSYLPAMFIDELCCLQDQPRSRSPHRSPPPALPPTQNGVSRPAATTTSGRQRGGGRGAASRQKALEKELRRAETAARRMERPEHCQKSLHALVDRRVLEVPGGGQLLAALQENSDVTVHVITAAQPGTVTWEREVSGCLERDGQAVTTTRRESQDHLVAVIEAATLASLVQTGQQTVSGGRGLTETMLQLGRETGKKVTILCWDLDKLCRTKKVTGSYGRAAAGGGGGRRLERLQLEDAVVDSLLETPHSLRIVTTPADGGVFLAQMTKAIAEEPFKRQRGRHPFAWFADADSARPVKVDASLRGLRRLWTEQLRPLCGGSLETAQAVGEAYPSPQALLQGFASCASVEQRERLVADLTVRSGDNKQPPVEAYCDMEFAGGNWTVIQRRDNIEPRQDFYLGWKEYKEGFGNVTQEFWWGLEHLFQLTSSDRRYELRVDLEAFDGSRRYATYQQFRISSELYGYRLSASDYSGNATDGLKYAVKRKFSTRDRDQDDWGDGHCAQDHQGAWWYSGCGWSNLNGRYRDGGDVDKTGIWWYRWRRFESLKKTAMKIRPT